MMPAVRSFLNAVEELVRAYADKLILVYLIHFLVIWERWDMVNTVLGAIIMLTTGKIIERKMNGGGSSVHVESVVVDRVNPADDPNSSDAKK